MLPLPTLTAHRPRAALARAHPERRGLPGAALGGLPLLLLAHLPGPARGGHHGARGRGGGGHQLLRAGRGVPGLRGAGSVREPHLGGGLPRGGPVRAACPGVPPRAPRRAGRVLRAPALRRRRDEPAGAVQRAHPPLHQPGDPQRGDVRADLVPAPGAAARRGRLQVLHPRGVLLGGAALRRRRCSSGPPEHHAPADGGRAGAHLRRAGARRPAPARVLRPGAGGRRLRVQDRRGAVPHVDPGRVRGRSHAGDRA